MFKLQEGQKRPSHAFRIEMSNVKDSIPHMIALFRSKIDQLEKLSVKNHEEVKALFSSSNKVKTFFAKGVNIDSKIFWNASKESFNKDFLVFYNIVINKSKNTSVKDHKDRVPNKKYGVVVYVYLIDSKAIKSKIQNDFNFEVTLKENAVIDTATVLKPFNSLFKVSNASESFYVRSKLEADFLEKEGYSFTAINSVEVNGRFFEVVQEIQSSLVKTIDVDKDKIKGYKTQKAAKLDGRQIFDLTVEGISGKNYFTMNFENAETGLYKTYGDVDGYILVEIVTTVLSGTKRVITFIRKNDKALIERIKTSVNFFE